MKYKYLLFDLDGTLTDPKEGITNAVSYALDKYNIHVEDHSELLKFIGPPLIDSFREYYGFSDKDARKLVDYYRVYFSSKGLFENVPYKDVYKMLDTLKARGYVMALCSSKPDEFCRRILDRFNLSSYFTFVGGASMDETRTRKEEVVEYTLKALGVKDKKEALMIGDRKHDIIGAKINGIDSLGVLYGYGDKKEHQEAGATYIAETMDDVLRILG